MIRNITFKNGKLTHKKRTVEDGKYLFAITVNNNINFGDITFDTHNKLSDIKGDDEGKDIMYCGEIKITDGEVAYWSNKSGHFRFDGEGKRFENACRIFGEDNFIKYSEFAEANFGCDYSIVKPRAKRDDSRFREMKNEAIPKAVKVKGRRK